MILVISDSIAAAYPELRIGVTVVRGLSNAGPNGALMDLSRSIGEEFLRAHSLDTLERHPNIVAWRDTYRSFGYNPKKLPPTAEAFCKRVLQTHGFVPWISKAVTSYLLSELEFLLPVGGYDLQQLPSGRIELRHSPGDEDFIPLGHPQGSPAKKTKSGEIVYADGDMILTRGWNQKDAEASKITEQSTEIVLFAEAAHPSISTADVVGITERLKEYLLRFCGGEARTFLAASAVSKEWKLWT